MFRIPLVALFCLTLFSYDANAYWIRDHAIITDKAIQGLQDCGFLPASWDDNLHRKLESANSDEDTNLFRKWGHYSHYFHPLKKLHMRRADSSVTVQESVDQISALIQSGQAYDSMQAYELLGRMIHHLQDATAPPHVVPVNHFLMDGFESYALDYPKNVDPTYCQKLTAADSMPGLLQTTALSTLESLEADFPLTIKGKPTTLAWKVGFWTEGPGEEFGTYGLFGDHFGRSNFVHGSDLIFVDQSVYQAFKKERMDRAVLVTQQAILWLLSRR